MELKKEISLKPFNTFGVDALARYFTQATTIDELQEALGYRQQTKDLLLLGGGSNVLFRNNFDGLVVRNNLKGISCVGEDEHFFYVKSAAGEVWHDFVLHCIDQGYAGVENLSLIPGSVGAAPMQNIGAYGVEIKQVFHELEALHIEDMSLHKFDNQACEFGYRESVFKRKLKNQFVIVSVTLKLRKKPEFNTSYGAIEQELEKQQVNQLSIRAISDAVIAIRQQKLPDPKKIGNAGSFFKNPVIEMSDYERLKDEFPDVAAYPAGEGKMKVAAGWLIDQAGWKGKTFGNYGVHKNQALVLVNYGGATGGEIYDLSEEILQSVKTKYGITLEREVNIID